MLQIDELLQQALSLSDAARQQLLLNLDPDIRMRLQTRLDSHQRKTSQLPSQLPSQSSEQPDSSDTDPTIDKTVISDSVSQSEVTSPTWTARTGSRFRVLRPHARGGLGEVFVARDEELRREVALKQIQTRFADEPESRTRFVLEAEITGGLEHPGIVPVYGLGQYSDGRPYYAMRFIRGDSLKEAIRTFHEGTPTNSSERILQLRQLLGRFVDVCQAVSYAHSRGVLHRDLKPGNIMLGKYGETLVVDWGLAKLADSQEPQAVNEEQSLRPASGSGITPTLMGSTVGTPAYMPPEQAAGRLEELGPASDVYSLGATLYHLLTGQTPFRNTNVLDLLKDVQAGTFAAPRSIQPEVPLPLEAICLKAMSTAPTDRYPGPQDLANDIERFLADEPVTALHEPLSIKVRRWMRKHPTLISTTAAVVLLSAIGLGVFSSVVSGQKIALAQANKELAQSNAALDSKNAELLAANEREQQARELAETNEATAQRQTSLAMSTMTDVIFDIQKGLQRIPGGAQIRRNLLETSLQKLNEVGSKYVQQTAVDFNTMIALMEMGDLIMQFGKAPRIGHIEQATASPPNAPQQQTALPTARHFFQRALQIGQQLNVSDPGDRTIRQSVSVIHSRIGDLLLQQGQVPEAEMEFQKAHLNFTEMAETDPADVGVQQLLAASHTAMGDAKLKGGLLAEAEQQYMAALNILQALKQDDPASPETNRLLSIVYMELGDVMFNTGRLQDADDAYRSHQKISEQRVTATPTDPRAQRALAISHGRIGKVRMKAGQLAEAEQEFRKTLAIDQSLSAADPDNLQAQSDVANDYDEIGMALLMAGDPEQASRQFHESLRLRQILADGDPEDVAAQRNLFRASNRVGEALLEQERYDEAEQQFLACLEIDRKLAEAAPGDADAQRSLSISYEKIGTVRLRSGRAAEAAEPYRQCMELRRRYAAVDPTDARAQRDLAVAHNKLGEVLLETERPDEALVEYQHCLDVFLRLAAADPANAMAQRDVLIGHYQTGTVYMQQQKFDAAIESFHRGKAVAETLIENRMLKSAAPQLLDVLNEAIADAKKKKSEMRPQQAE